MTCIVGLIDKDVTYIGADSLGSNGYSKIVRNDRKVFHMKDIQNAVIGYTSSYRMGQLLMYATGLIDKRDVLERDLDHEYLVNKFIPNVHKLFNDGGYGKTHEGQKDGGVFLLGYKNKLYEIESDFQVGESAKNYNSVGCGDNYALGSLFSTEGTDLSPIERIHKALQAATEFSTGVQGPYYILNTKTNEVVVIND